MNGVVYAVYIKVETTRKENLINEDIDKSETQTVPGKFLGV